MHQKTSIHKDKRLMLGHSCFEVGDHFMRKPLCCFMALARQPIIVAACGMVGDSLQISPPAEKPPPRGENESLV